ncbi:50S ribosomal protein L5 [Candidatus Aerophobetes bacterium]|uniref:Large ribosomal subunit protein uL5 n=1 Tax=Aerophobetes bacterium TaxID=2030807 RepID=A0A2A4X759_UNCAE|nr:MAG: 50S ribosomal protein L5 [Candidatus Aerophobetes bacterium]
MSRLKQLYQDVVKEKLQKKFGYKNVNQIPKLKSIVLSMGLAEALKDKNIVEDSAKHLALISGQKPIETKAKKSISNFKLRDGQVIGLKVTLRSKRMYEFMDRFCSITSPRILDFRGFNTKTNRGCYSTGLKDHQVFTELNLDEVKREQGMNITFITSADSGEECFELLSGLGFPFKKVK